MQYHHEMQIKFAAAPCDPEPFLKDRTIRADRHHDSTAFLVSGG